MYKLYYLVDQFGAVDGEKTFQGDFESLALAKLKAASENVAHFSVEYVDGSVIEVVFIV